VVLVLLNVLAGSIKKEFLLAGMALNGASLCDISGEDHIKLCHKVTPFLLRYEAVSQSMVVDIENLVPQLSQMSVLVGKT